MIWICKVQACIPEHKTSIPNASISFLPPSKALTEYSHGSKVFFKIILCQKPMALLHGRIIFEFKETSVQHVSSTLQRIYKCIAQHHPYQDISQTEGCYFSLNLLCEVFDVLQAVTYLKDYVLNNGPIVMEADTYRYHGHSMSDPGSTYRTRDEITSMRQQRDPIEHVRRLLIDNKLLDTSELKKLEKVTLSSSKPPHTSPIPSKFHPAWQ